MTNVISRIWLAGGLFALTITIFALFSMPASAGRIDNQALINGLLANLIEDSSQALQILRPLAEKGEPLAQMFLGRLYEKGEGAPFDCAEAVKWFTRAAEQGDADAQFGLGSLHHQGQCVAKNDRTAVIWFERSGKKGDPRGLSAIGEIYLGHGDIPTDYGKAIVWFLRAAMLADAEAIYKLGVLNALGQGVPKDNLEAYIGDRPFSNRSCVTNASIGNAFQLSLTPCIFPLSHPAAIDDQLNGPIMTITGGYWRAFLDSIEFWHNRNYDRWPRKVHNGILGTAFADRKFGTSSTG